MEKETPNIEDQISALLKKKNKDYLTITQIRNSLAASVLNHFGIKKQKSSVSEVLKKLKPYIGSCMWEYRGAKTVYIGFRKSFEEIILNKIREQPNISSKNLSKDLPMLKKDFISTLNKLLESGNILCTLNEEHTVFLKISDLPVSAQNQGTKRKIRKNDSNDTSIFKTAYESVRNGGGVVRIHRIREYLDWSRERFDKTLKKLMADYTVELHGGDPSVMTEKEIKDSFTDKEGLLYINLTWWGKNDNE